MVSPTFSQMLEELKNKSGKSTNDGEEEEYSEDVNAEKQEVKPISFNHDDIAAGIVPQIVQSSVLNEREELKKKYQEKLKLLREKRKQPIEMTPEKQQSKKQKREKKKSEKRKSDKNEKKREKIDKTPPKPPQKSFTVPDLPKSSASTKSEEKSPLKKTKSGTDIEYSKIEFTNTPSIPPVHSAKRKLSKAQLLRQAEAKRQKLEELKETKPEKAVVVENKMAWETMIKRASGEKVYDDPKKIKKTLKRQQSQKRKSKKDWKKRNSEQQKSVKDRQEKYQDSKKKMRERKASKNLRKNSRPGFEGKKKEFINKS